MSRTRVKICGLTRSTDIDAAVAAGADALGFVFYPPSPRTVSEEQAAALVKSVPPFVCPVGLFVNEQEGIVERVLAKVPLGLLQFHGDEERHYCEQFGLPYIKAIRVQNAQQLTEEIENHPNAQGYLLDTYVKGVAGGTGLAFDWDLIPQDLNASLVLAGGLTPENVASAIQQVNPFAVDVSGGVEEAKGIKDHQKIIRFINEVNRESRN